MEIELNESLETNTVHCAFGKRKVEALSCKEEAVHEQSAETLLSAHLK